MEELVLGSVADAVASLDHAQAQVRAGEVATFLAIAAVCDLHQVDESVLFEGAERWVRGGADGTPLIGEFIAGEIAGVLGCSIGAAFARIATVLNLRHRHPLLWNAVIGGAVRTWEAGWVAEACEAAGLSGAACRRVDRLCAVALAQQPFQRVRAQLPGWIILADPARAAEREQAAGERRHVTVGDLRDGHVSLWGQLDAADGLALDDALSGIAEALPGCERDAGRAAALGVLARHALGQQALPLAGHDPACRPRAAERRPVEVVVHIDVPGGGSVSPATATDGPAPGARAFSGEAALSEALSGEAITGEHVGSAGSAGGCAVLVRGWGHLPLARLGDLFRGSRVTVRPVVVAAEIAPVDGYVVPAPMRRALEARNPVDAFPFGVRSSSVCDADHTIAYQRGSGAPPGQTRLANLVPLSRFTHRLKTHGGWRVEQPAPGVLLWASPLGYRYLVTPSGSVMIDRPPPSRNEWWRVEPPDPDDPAAVVSAEADEAACAAAPGLLVA